MNRPKPPKYGLIFGSFKSIYNGKHILFKAFNGGLEQKIQSRKRRKHNGCEDDDHCCNDGFVGLCCKYPLCCEERPPDWCAYLDLAEEEFELFDDEDYYDYYDDYYSSFDDFGVC